MLPDLRAIIAALVTSASLLLIGYGVVVSLRTAQDRTVSPLQETRERLRANPFAAAPPPVLAPAAEALPSIETPAPEVRSAAAAPDPLASPAVPRAETQPMTSAETPAADDRSVAAAPEAASPSEADAPSAELPNQPAVAADQPSDRFVIESLVCPPATTTPQPALATPAGADATEPAAAPPAIATVPLPRERPPMGGPAPDEPGVTGNPPPNRSTAAPPRATQKQGAKRLAARAAPRPRPALRARPAPAPRQKGLLETLFGR